MTLFGLGAMKTEQQEVSKQKLEPHFVVKIKYVTFHAKMFFNPL